MTSSTTPFEFDDKNKAIPLTTRKNIRDSFAKRDELLNSIKINGEPLTLEVQGDLPKLFADANYGPRIGEIFHEEYLGALVTLLKNAQADEMVWDHMCSALHKRKLIIRTGDDVPTSGYQRLSIEDGSLVVAFHPSNLWSNLSEVSYTKAGNIPGIDSYTGPSANDDIFGAMSKDNKALPIGLRMNIRETEAIGKANAEEIEKASGIKFTYSFPIGLQVNESHSYKDRLGEVFLDWYMTNLKEMLVKQLADDMVKEAFEEAVTEKKIVFGVAATPRPSGGNYQRLVIRDGALVVEFDVDHLATNLSEISNFKLEEIL